MQNLISIGRALLILALVVFVSGLIGCNSDDDKKDNFDDKEETCNNTTADGYQTLTHDSETREYILHVPSSYDENTPTSLIINFHGFGGCASDFAADIGLSLIHI